MKNWIIVLLIFILPLGLYAYLDAKAAQQACTVSGGASNITGAKLIKFSSPMCSECQEVAAEIKKAMKDFEGAILVEEYNVLDNYDKSKNATKDMIKKYKITLVPTLIFINKEGKIVKRQEGMMKSSEIADILDEIK